MLLEMYKDEDDRELRSDVTAETKTSGLGMRGTEN